MQLEKLKYLVCPAPRVKQRGKCAGALSLHGGEIPLRPFEGDPNDVMEGGVRCEECKAWYPIIGGVLLLLHRPKEYLAARYPSIVSQAGMYGGLSQELLTWLRDQHFDLYDLARHEDKMDVNLALHYDRVADILSEAPLPPSFRKFLEEWDGRTPYDVLSDMAKRHVLGRGLALDSGSGPGGLVFRLSETFENVFGVDLSYASVLLGRSVLLHRPCPTTRHLVRRHRDAFVERPLSVERARNVELLVADCMNLPFADGALDLAASANIVDVVHPRTPLREAARVLREKGVLLFTDPFKVPGGPYGQGGPDPLEGVRNYLEALGFSCIEEKDYVPWIWHRYRRQLQIYFNYCGAFRKGAPKEA